MGTLDGAAARPVGPDRPVPGSRPPAGRIRVDCHLHTVASGDSVLTVDELAARAKEAGLDAVFITDHNVTAAAAGAASRDLGVRVIVGEEVRTPYGDVIGLFLTERIPYVLPLPEVVARIRSQGALVYVPHPFDPVRASLGRTGAGDTLTALCSAGEADIIEVFNAKTADQSHNERAARLAERFALPAGAGSDAHDGPGVGAAYLEMPDFDGPASFLAALAAARVVGEYRDYAPRYPPPARLPAARAWRSTRPFGIPPTARSWWPAARGGRRRRRGTARSTSPA